MYKKEYTQQKDYEAPKAEIIGVKVETGFALSTTDGEYGTNEPI